MIMIKWREILIMWNNNNDENSNNDNVLIMKIFNINIIVMK